MEEKPIVSFKDAMENIETVCGSYRLDPGVEQNREIAKFLYVEDMLVRAKGMIREENPRSYIQDPDYIRINKEIASCAQHIQDPELRRILELEASENPKATDSMRLELFRSRANVMATFTCVSGNIRDPKMEDECWKIYRLVMAQKSGR